MQPSPEPGADAAPRSVVVIGASAGGVEALRRVVSGLPPDLSATVCVVLHLAPRSPSALAAILQRTSSLPCRPAVDGEALRDGEILVAPPDRHLTVSDGRVALTVGPRENGHRPAVDALFRTAAEAQTGKVIGVVLSGNRDDGTGGLAVIKARGGTAIVQDPEEAMYPGMPASAVAHVAVDAVLPSDQIAAMIVRVVNGEVDPVVPAADPVPGGNPGRQPKPGLGDAPEDPVPGGSPGAASGVAGAFVSTCPECGGVLEEHEEAGVAHWRCRVGHRYSSESLADAQAEGVEAALWAAIRALDDRRSLLVRIADQFEQRGRVHSAESFRQRAGEVERQVDAISGALQDAASGSLQKFSDSEAVQTDQRTEGARARVRLAAPEPEEAG